MTRSIIYITVSNSCIMNAGHSKKQKGANLAVYIMCGANCQCEQMYVYTAFHSTAVSHTLHHRHTSAARQITHTHTHSQILHIRQDGSSTAAHIRSTHLQNKRTFHLNLIFNPRHNHEQTKPSCKRKAGTSCTVSSLLSVVHKTVNYLHRLLANTMIPKYSKIPLNVFCNKNFFCLFV